MEEEYRNPRRLLDERPWIAPSDDRYQEISELLFDEFLDADLIYYCSRHHSIETKYTERKHKQFNCLVYTRGAVLSKILVF